MRPDLPSGTVTFLFTDVEGSTNLLHELGPDGYADALAQHRRIVRDAFAAHGGVEVDTQGDAFFVAFPTAPGAIAAASGVRDALAAGPIRVRMGIHTGTPHLTGEGYIGPDVHRAARIAAAGHGEQVLVSAATVALVGTEGLRDLGEHRLKDFAEPVLIYQLGDERFPPLRTISNTNLPRPASSFVGREREVKEVAALLQDGARLLTLTGPGGSGKTRLAIEAAASLIPDFKAGVFWVGLAPLRDPALVTGTIGQTIGAKDGLAEHIGERQMLLLLDNLEQVIAAAPELATLVEACPNLHLLVTSRELLRVRGEIEYPVTPLVDLDAVDLFCTRARAVSDDTIHRLCRALDNLPLAIELAAARASVLTPAQILERLSQRLDLLKGGRDADPRQQTLRATIEWSFDLLNPDEQGLFARLAVFAGGSTLEAAEQIAKADLNTLQSLVDKSLVRRTGDRFSMLETIREFAAERLQALGEASTVRQRHIVYLTELAEHWYARRYTLESTWVPILEAETDNIRAALDLASQGSTADEIRLAGAIAESWRTHGRGPEARARVEAAIRRHAAFDPLRARGLMYLGGFDDDLSSLREALELWRANGDAVGEADTLETMGWVHDALGQYDAAHDTHQQSLAARSRALEPEAHGLGSRAGLCHIFVAQGNTSRAAAEARELLAIARRNQAVYMQELALHFLADCPLVDGRYEESERAYRTALQYAHEAGLIGRETDEVLGVAMSLAGQGQAAAALRIAASAHVKQREIAMSTDRWWQSMQDRLLGDARRDLGATDGEQVEQEGAETPFDHIVERLLPPAEANADVAS